MRPSRLNLVRLHSGILLTIFRKSRSQVTNGCRQSIANLCDYKIWCTRREQIADVFDRGAKAAKFGASYNGELAWPCAEVGD